METRNGEDGFLEHLRLQQAVLIQLIIQTLLQPCPPERHLGGVWRELLPPAIVSHVKNGFATGHIES